MEVAVRDIRTGKAVDHRPFCDIIRPGVNDWIVVMGDVRGPDGGLARVVDLVLARIRSTATSTVLPSALLREVDGLLAGFSEEAGTSYTCSAVLARIEVDSCGASVTLAGAGLPRSIVVRHAGWVDIRGHSSPALGAGDAAPADDRVGLGPGDAFVVCSEAVAASENADTAVVGEKVLPDALVDAVEESADGLADCILAAAKEFEGHRLDDDGFVLVLRVPEAVRHDGVTWVTTSTGTPADQVRLPGYSLRAEQSDLWGRPVTPPREALMRLAPVPPSIPALRRLLRRLLQSWRMDGAAEGDIELLATEVATDAFARTASPVTVVVRYTGTVVRIEIGDGEREPPRKRALAFDDLRGHRLALVESLAEDWGVLTTPTGTRRWFEVAIGDRD